MAKQIKPEDRRFISKVENRLAKGWGWQQIADDLQKPLSTCYQSYFRLRARLAEIERIAA